MGTQRAMQAAPPRVLTNRELLERVGRSRDAVHGGHWGPEPGVYHPTVSPSYGAQSYTPTQMAQNYQYGRYVMGLPMSNATYRDAALRDFQMANTQTAESNRDVMRAVLSPILPVSVYDKGQAWEEDFAQGLLDRARLAARAESHFGNRNRFVGQAAYHAGWIDGAERQLSYVPPSGRSELVELMNHHAQAAAEQRQRAERLDNMRRLWAGEGRNTPVYVDPLR